MINTSIDFKKINEYTNEELFIIYNETKDLEIKKEIALRFVPTVKSIALQMKNVYLGFEEVEAIVNEGVLVILKAIDKFDLSQNVKFETFISKRVRGMIIDLARKQDFVSRGIRKGYNDITIAATEFYQKNGREATPEEIMNILEIDEKKYNNIMNKSNLLNILSLDITLEEVASKQANHQPEEAAIFTEQKTILKEALTKLRENEQMVIALYYMEEVSMKEIGNILSISEARVSQIHSRAIVKLRTFLKEA